MLNSPRGNLCAENCYSVEGGNSSEESASEYITGLSAGDNKLYSNDFTLKLNKPKATQVV